LRHRYQATIEGLIEFVGTDDNGARGTMLEAVRIAQLATKSGESASIALSLGPFGGTLRPTQEFLGFYPPPYGPRGYTDTGENTRCFENPNDEEAAVEALAVFHFNRIMVYANNEDVWEAIRYLAFETILLPREVTAIRKAVSMLKNQGFEKPWWISFVIPSDYPDANATEDLVKAATSSSCEYPLPEGIGINCTSLQRLRSLVLRLPELVPESLKHNLLLVLYPNGGEYDEAGQCWKPRTDGDSVAWAKDFAAVLRVLVASDQWKGVIAGGCCRTYPSHIRELRAQTREL